MLTLFVKITPKKKRPQKSSCFFYRNFPHLHFRMLVKITKFSSPLMKKTKINTSFSCPRNLQEPATEESTPKAHGGGTRPWRLQIRQLWHHHSSCPWEVPPGSPCLEWGCRGSLGVAGGVICFKPQVLIKGNHAFYTRNI